MSSKKHRKSPHKHKVRTHTRGGRTVHEYERGAGDKPQRIKRRRTLVESVTRKKKTTTAESGEFDVRVEYTDASYEHIDVTAPDYTEALDAGIETRKVIKEPVMIRMRRR